jgi:uncharacterized protein (DUF433 family)
MGDLVSIGPRGHYLAHEAGVLAGVSGNKIGQWARRKYIRSSQSAPGERPRVYSFQDVAEAMLVHELLENHVRHRDIRRAIESLREIYGDEGAAAWPLTLVKGQLAIAPPARRDGSPGDGLAAVILQGPGEAYDIGRQGWQQLIEPEHLVRIVGDLRRGGWAVREAPDMEHIEVDPDRMSGRPTIKGRRLPVDQVAELVDSPEGLEILREDYELSDAEVADAKRWWSITRRYEAA